MKRLALCFIEYQNSRAGACPKDYLQGFTGYLQVDGYAAYEQTEATLVGCFAHARRKFVEAKKAQPKGKSDKVDMALAIIQKLYQIETRIKHLSAREKQEIRQERSKPLLEKYKAWLDKSALQVPPKSAPEKAIAYNLRQWPKLVRYIEDGANASAVLYSLVETAKANGLVPFDYLRYQLEELPKVPEGIDHLLPWNVEQS